MNTFAKAISKLFELHGGKKNFFKIMDDRFKELNDLWNQETAIVGRVLKAHLIVEHYLTQYLQYQNPNIGNLNKAKLSFFQKIELLNDNDISISFLKPGLIQINRIRNKLAHNLKVEITESDKNLFLSILMYKSMRTESEKRSGKMADDDPLSIFEDFSKFASTLLQAGSVLESEHWKTAISELKEEDFD